MDELIVRIISLGIIGLINAFILFLFVKKDRKANKTPEDSQRNNILSKIKILYDQLLQMTNLADSSTVKVTLKNEKNWNIDFLCWLYDETLYLLPDWENVKNNDRMIKYLKKYHDDSNNDILISIPVSNIGYFAVKGEILYSETKVLRNRYNNNKTTALNRGENGHLNRKNVTSVSMHTCRHDNRVIEMKYYNNNRKLKSMIFTYDSYHSFQNIIPQKEYGASINNPEQDNKISDIKEVLYKLNGLRQNADHMDEYNDQKKLGFR